MNGSAYDILVFHAAIFIVKPLTLFILDTCKQVHWTNSADSDEVPHNVSDEVPHNVAFHQDLHCSLLKIHLKTFLDRNILNFRNFKL